jgi:phosphoribosylglycinamide formyltransferase-1
MNICTLTNHNNHDNPITVGLITYHYPHLKTEQVLQTLLHKKLNFKMFALPFTQRKIRETLFIHRPNQVDAIASEVLAEKHSIPYIKCNTDKDIDNSCDVYLVLGAGIISAECINGKKIINCHPGIIPACRGLDSFKWAIYDMKPLGITLHYIDSQIDAGDLISIIPTNIYKTDSLTTLARRHYENEIDCLSNFSEYLEHPQNPFSEIAVAESRMRMPLEKERELVRRFSEYTEIYGI